MRFAGNGTSLSDISAATANNTINNGANAQAWNWQLAGNTTAFNIGENVASTGGSGSQYLMNIGTLAGSTAMPLRVATRGVEAFRVDVVNPQLVANAGTAAAPSYAFNGSASTGLYAPAVNELGASVNGVQAMRITAAGSLALGAGSLLVDTSGSALAIGTQALAANSYGDRNTAIGLQSLSSNTGGASNVAVGFNTLLANTFGGYNTAIGDSALYSNSVGSRNQAIGAHALYANTSGFDNQAMGDSALANNSTGNANQAIGTNTLVANTSGYYNAAIGKDALGSNTTGFQNIAIGPFALLNNIDGNKLVAIGTDALLANTNGTRNVGIGNFTLMANTTGYDNVGLGANALGATTTGAGNVGVGRFAGVWATTSSASTFVGNFTSVTNDPVMNATGAVTLIGAGAVASGLAAAIPSAYMTALGANASVTTANTVVLGRTVDKTVIGATGDDGTAYNLQVTGGIKALSGGLQVAGGDLVLNSNSITGLLSARPAAGVAGRIYIATDTNQLYRDDGTSWNAFAAGNVALSSITAATANNTLNNGANAQAWNWNLTSDTTAFNIGENVASTGGTGTQYLAMVGTLAGSTAIPLRVSTRGTEAFRVDSINPQIVANGGTAAAPSYSFTGSQSAGFYSPAANEIGASISGTRAMRLTAGSIGIGSGALAVDTSGTSYAIGTQALTSNTTGAGNFATGYQALQMNTTGSGNIATGRLALQNNTTGLANIASGSYALRANTNGFGNVGMGDSALNVNTTGSENTAIGYTVLSSNTVGNYNVAIGAEAMLSNTTGNSNVALGYLGLYRNTTGGDNIAVGYSAIGGNTTGNYNIGLGKYVLEDLVSGSDNVALGTQAGNNNVSGSRNTSLGAGARPLTGALNYATSLGSDSRVSSSNTIALGRTTDTTVIGATGTLSSSPNNARLQVTGNTNIVQNATLPGLVITGKGIDSTSPSDNTAGVFLGLGYNGGFGSRQLWIGATDNIGNGSASVFRYQSGSNLASVDAVSGDGVTRLPMTLGTDSTSVAVGAGLANGVTAYNAALPGKLSVYAEAAGKGLVVKGAASQTGNLLELQNNAATSLFSVSSSGNVVTSGGLNVAGGNLILGSTAVSGAFASMGAAGTANRIYIATDTKEIYRDNGTTWDKIAAGTTSLSSLTAATAANTINNGANAQTWNWALSGNTTGYSITENTASTGGTGTQYLAKIGTIAASTAIPLSVSTRGAEAFRVDSVNPQLVANNGTAAAPSYAFAGEQSTGLYLPAAGELAASVGGVRSMRLTAGSVAVGKGALAGVDTSATATAIGTNALAANTSGLNNTAVGFQALKVNTTAANNSAFGSGALAANTSGAINTAVGKGALGNNNIGGNNTAVGALSQGSNASGTYNNALGSGSLFGNSTGSFNNAVGYWALFGSTGNSNNALGSLAGFGVSTGSNNTLLGDVADVLDGTLTYATALGSGAQVGTSNTIALGRTTDKTVIGATGTDGTAYNLQVTGGIKALTGGIRIGAGTAAIAPLALQSGVNLTTPSAGSVEYDGANLYFTPAASRKTVAFLDSNITGTSGNVTGVVVVANGGTGATTAAGARTNLAAAASGTNGDITSLTGLTTALSVAQGGTGVTTSTGTGSVVLSASPTFTGVPLAPTAAISTNNTQIATTGYVGAQIANDALLKTGGTLTGNLTLTAGLSLTGGNLVLGSAAVSGLSTGLGAAGTTNRIYIATDTREIYRDNGTTWDKIAAGSPALSSLSAATAANTINNGANAQTWNWALTGNATGYSITENTASTGGTGTQYLAKIGTIAASTAIPLSISTRGAEAFRVDSVNPQLVANNGTAAAPSYAFAGEQSTGLYLPAAGELAASVAGVRSMRLTAGSVSLGRGAMASNTSADSAAFGTGALAANTTGSLNTAVGFQALFVNTTNLENTAIGARSMQANTNGSLNAAVGSYSLGSNTFGASNIAMGSSTLGNNTTGSDNTGLGDGALRLNTTGGSNAAVGSFALRNSNGSQNAALGRYAGYLATNNITGANSTFIGYNATVADNVNMAQSGQITLLGAGTSASGLGAVNANAYMTAIGAGASVTTINTVALGRITDTTVIGATGSVATGNLNGALLQVTGNIGATGAVKAASFAGDGSALTNINAGNITTGVLSPVRGGTGIDGSTAANGTLLIGNGSGYTLSTLAAGAGIGITNGAGSITLVNTGVTSFNTRTGAVVLTKPDVDGVVTLAASASAGAGEVNLALGNNALGGGVARAANVAIGQDALSSMTGAVTFGSAAYGIKNTAVGYQALKSNTTGSFNNAQGTNALSSNTTGSYNNATGYLALTSNTTGAYNTANGSSALFTNTTGIENSALGVSALYANISGNLNSAVGMSALFSNTTGNNNSALGRSALWLNTTGNDNVALGRRAGSTTSANVSTNANTTGSNNTFLGAYAMPGTPTQLTYATALGSDALVTTSSTIALGRTTDKTVIGATGDDGTAYNLQVTGGIKALTGGFNANNGAVATPSYTFAGETTTGFYLPAAGELAASVAGVRSMRITSGSMSIGKGALTSDASGNATAVGTNALAANTSGGLNTAVGLSALSSNTTGGFNTGLGVYALNGNVSGAWNVAVGVSAMVNAYAGSDNTGIGGEALHDLNGGVGNSAVGRYALYSSNGADYNVALGYNALRNNLSGGANSAVGVNAGISNVSGTYNTFIGVNTNATSAALNYATAVGGGATVSTSNTVVLGRTTDKTIIGATGDNGTGNKLQVTGGIGLLGGAANAPVSYTIGRTGAEASLGIAGTALQFSSSANAGDFVLRTESGSANILLQNGTNAAALTIQNNYVTIANQLTASGGVVAGNGTVAAPSYTFAGDTATGFYLPAAGELGASVGGTRAMRITAAGSVGLGGSSLLVDTSATATAVGTNALRANTTGANNTAIGRYAGYADSSGTATNANTTGSNNTFLGNYARPGTITQLTYATVLGSDALVTTSNTVVLGRTTDNVAIGQTGAGAYQFTVNGTAGGTSAYTVSSDIRFKKNITPVVNALNTISSLQGVHYEFDQAAFPDKKFESGRQLGFIAQQIEQFVPEVVRTDRLGYKSVQYSQLVPLLAEGIKAQQLILKHLTMKDPATLLVDIKTFQAADAIFDNIKATNIKTANLEAETARIKKLDADRIEAKFVRSDVVKSGEVEVFVSYGTFQPIFAPQADSQYIVNATAEDGSSAFASVAFMGGKIMVTPISGKGVDVTAIGAQVGLVAPSKKIKATWIRMS